MENKISHAVRGVFSNDSGTMNHPRSHKNPQLRIGYLAEIEMSKHVKVTLYQNKYRVESTRLRDWDYGASGYYFVAICTNGRLCLLGDIENNEMRLNAYGEIARGSWSNISD